jgi:hypothetical protein
MYSTAAICGMHETQAMLCAALCAYVQLLLLCSIVVDYAR